MWALQSMIIGAADTNCCTTSTKTSKQNHQMILHLQSQIHIYGVLVQKSNDLLDFPCQSISSVKYLMFLKGTLVTEVVNKGFQVCFQPGYDPLFSSTLPVYFTRQLLSTLSAIKVWRNCYSCSNCKRDICCSLLPKRKLCKDTHHIIKLELLD